MITSRLNLEDGRGGRRNGEKPPLGPNTTLTLDTELTFLFTLGWCLVLSPILSPLPTTKDRKSGGRNTVVRSAVRHTHTGSTLGGLGSPKVFRHFLKLESSFVCVQ